MRRPTKLPMPANRAPKATVLPDRRFYISVKPQDLTLKTTGVVPSDIVRVLAKPARGLYRDGERVGDVFRRVGDPAGAKRMMLAACKHGLIGIVDGGTPPAPAPAGEGDDD